eukprot:m.851733 g.851733  ORF g.851733 m.851733 type:complete len:583 (-) comp23493_c0_seq5:2212-3960(-)
MAEKEAPCTSSDRNTSMIPGISPDIVPIKDSEDDNKIVKLIESLAHDGDREATLRQLVNLFNSKIDELKSSAKKEATISVAAFQRHIRSLIRLSRNCPHENIRSTLGMVVERLRECDQFDVPEVTSTLASSFVAPDQICTMDGGPAENDEEVQSEFIEAFRADGRVSHMTMVMGCHPRYLKRFREVHNCLFWDQGPLPVAERHIIAVMAAGRYNCRYLLEIHAQHFLRSGGAAEWLSGSDGLPPKLRNLLGLNVILAHQPWLLHRDDIAELLKSGADSWSMNELIQAIVILIHIHALQGFVHGCGVNDEVDLVVSMCSKTVGAGVPPASSDCGASGGADTTSSSASGVDDKSSSAPERSSVLSRIKAAQAAEVEEDSEEANLQNFVLIETDTDKIPQQQQSQDDTIPPYVCMGSTQNSARYTPEHVEFDVRTDDYSIFKTQDFSWEDQGFSILSRYYPDIAEFFDCEFNEIKNLTYNTYGDEHGLDTFDFRWAIWNYVLRIKGVANDEYMYRAVNKLLDRPLKTYVKSLVCYPQCVTKENWDTFISDVKDTEKVHVNLLAMCARKQASLLYALQVVSQYMGE